MADMDVKTIRQMYREPMKYVSLATLDKLAQVLEIDVSQLVESVPDLPKSLEASIKHTQERLAREQAETQQ